MAENRRYYWLKLPEDFFRDKRIKRLRRISGGDTFTIIYLKMLLLGMEEEGKLYFDGVEEDFVTELALELDEEEDDVKMTVQFLHKVGLLAVLGEDEYLLTEMHLMIGSETASTRRSRESREKKKTAEQLENTTKALQCNTNATNGNESATESKSKSKSKEINKEKEIYIEREEREKATATKNNCGALSTKLYTELSTNGESLRKQVRTVLDEYKLSADDIHVIANKMEKRLQEGLKADIEYLQEKIDFIEYEGKDVKQCLGYFITVVEEDWARSKKPFPSKYKPKKVNTAFHNFEPSKSEKYSDENLSKIMRGK